MDTVMAGGKLTKLACVDPGEHAEYIRATHGHSVGLRELGGVVLLYQNAAVRNLHASAALSAPVPWVSADLRILGGPGEPVGVCSGFGIGGPATAVIAEQLIALGAQRLIAVGTAGGLGTSVAVGDLILCESAIRAEGVSHHYWEHGEPARPTAGLTHKLLERLRTTACRLHRGTSWTTDALYRETREKADEYARQGALVVEMEAAAFFAVGRYRDIECAAAFAVSDLLMPGRRTPRGARSDATATSLNTAVHAAISTLRN
ncbi:hypothetical protein BJF79_09645 [Actinomadura sp. CNU-125]|uniref:nucleoside phosphorylase n=1 Tax=Actinomadura sp. CNU-125 TaxID=1904961 RepID=UPI00095C529B|nr:nucleoside phosphorylase [Actinomadura sp. CNU-125]OLT30512.1 hypothetical protein BJF79_09645 [Actinomadura sp. CNU-125]